MNKVKTLALALTAMITMQAAQAQTADEIVNKNIEAMGGKDKLLSIKTVKMTGSLTVQGMDIGITRTASHNVGMRVDISVPGMGEGFQIMTTTKGWGFMPFQGQTSPEEVPEDQVKDSQGDLDLQGQLVNYKEKGVTVEAQGKEVVDGVECYKLKITSKNGKSVTSYFDAKTYYRVKTVSKRNVNGQETDVETLFSDYKKTADGYVFAHAQTNAIGTITFSSIEVNKPVDESIYVVK